MARKSGKGGDVENVLERRMAYSRREVIRAPRNDRMRTVGQGGQGLIQMAGAEITHGHSRSFVYIRSDRHGPGVKTASP